MADLETSKRAPVAGLVDVIAERWSPRAFSEKPVSEGDLRKVFQAAAWAASSTNEQPWRFVVGRKGDVTHGKIVEAMAEGNQVWAKEAPVLVFSAARKTFSVGASAGKANFHALHDLGAASATLSSQATALGLHTHGMAGYDHDKMRRLLGIPEEYEMGAAWAIGYLGDVDTLPEPLKTRELATRTRKEVAEFVFTEWAVPAAL